MDVIHAMVDLSYHLMYKRHSGYDTDLLRTCANPAADPIPVIPLTTNTAPYSKCCGRAFRSFVLKCM